VIGGPQLQVVIGADDPVLGVLSIEVVKGGLVLPLRQAEDDVRRGGRAAAETLTAGVTFRRSQPPAEHAGT
jgi:hypothetical protein